MKKILFFFLLMLAVLPASADLVAKLPQVARPHYIVLTNERIYIAEESSQVHIYNRGPKGIAFLKTFGQEGDGPGEFNEIYHVYPLKDHLEILSFNRFSRFSLDGRFLDEMKLPLRVFKDGLFHIGENYLARDLRYEDSEVTVRIRLYDKKFKMIRELVTHSMPLNGKINLASDYYSARAVGDRAYVIESGNETKLTVYDQAGAKLSEIRLPLEPVQVSPELKGILFKPFKEQPEWHSNDEALYSFPAWTPGLDYFEVVEGKCIARTYAYRGDLVEFIIFDLQGKELNRVFLPNLGCLFHRILFCFFQDRFCYLRKNPEDGAWELHEEKAW